MEEHLPFDETSFSGELPLFPLPNVVLLPGGIMTLRVFEPRYREMVGDIVNSERYLGMVMLKPGYEKDYENNPEVFSHACLSELMNEEKLDDGRWIVTIRGLRRVRLKSENHDRSYRVAKVKVVRDFPGTLESELLRMRQLIAQTTMRLASTKFKDPDELLHLLSVSPKSVDNGLFFDLIAAVTPLEIDERRHVLEASTLCERAHTLLAALTRIVVQQQRRAQR